MGQTAFVGQSAKATLVNVVDKNGKSTTVSDPAALQWASSDTSVLTVTGAADGTAEVAAVAPGTADVTCTDPATSVVFTPDQVVVSAVPPGPPVSGDVSVGTFA